MEKFKSPTTGETFTVPEICSFIEKDFEYEVFVGTDSQVHRKKRKVLYVSCIVLYKKGKGGKIFIHKEWEALPNSLRQRLTNEVWRSVQLCFTLGNYLPENAEIVVDVDLNQHPKHKSSDYVQELVGMVTGQGFKCRAKPHSWAAMCVADRYSK